MRMPPRLSAVALALATASRIDRGHQRCDDVGRVAAGLLLASAAIVLMMASLVGGSSGLAIGTGLLTLGASIAAVSRFMRARATVALPPRRSHMPVLQRFWRRRLG